jgi:hypothetical protein
MISRRSAKPRTLAAALLTLATASVAHAGAFIGAGETFGPDMILHSKGYTGTGGALQISVCLDPSTPNAAAVEQAVRNIVITYNALSPTTGNLVSGAGNNIPANQIDFESVALHELGHCLGLAHPNLGSESGLFGSNAEFTRSTNGADNVYDLDDGPDDVIGTSDDVRGDDVNLHWFRTANNDPFTIDATVDATTYSRDLADLPGGHLFAASASRDVAAALGVPNTEAVMQQGTSVDEAQRRLAHDDVATLRYAESGVDETAGTGDDYTITLTYVGVTNACDIPIYFTGATSFASCSTSFNLIGGNHWRILGSAMYFNEDVNWFFNDVDACTDAANDGVPCDDTNPCTESDICQGLACTGTTLPNGTPCGDGDPCTGADVCQSGLCTPGPSICADHFVSYNVRASDAPSNVLPDNWTVQLDSTLVNDAGGDDPENYTVRRVLGLLLPAEKNDEGNPQSPSRHYLRYLLRRAKQGVGAPVNGVFPPAARHARRRWAVENQFGTLVVKSRRVSSLLLPAAKDLTQPPAPIGDADHFVCYRVVSAGEVSDQTPETSPGSGRGRFRTDLQAFFRDQFDDCLQDSLGGTPFATTPVESTCLFNVRRPLELCVPVVKSAVDPPRTTSATIAGSTPSLTTALVCYKAPRAVTFTSTDAAALGGGTVGEKIVPAQAPHHKHLLATANEVWVEPENLFPAPYWVDTLRSAMVCIPSVVTDIDLL